MSGVGGSTGFQYSSPVNFNIETSPPDIGDMDPVTANAFTEVYSGLNQIIYALVNYCGIGPQPSSSWGQIVNSPAFIQPSNLQRFYVTASEDIVAGAIVNLWNNGGTLQARNANATDNTKPGDGYCSTSGGIASGSVGEVILRRGIIQFSGLIPGTRYFLSTTNGVMANAPATATGNIEQYLGVALDDVNFSFDSGYWLQH